MNPPVIPRKLMPHVYNHLCSPLHAAVQDVLPLISKCNRPLQMEFEDQLHILIYFHLQEHKSGRHLPQSLEEDAFAREHVAPKKGILKSSFFEAMNERSLKQFLLVIEALQQQASADLPDKLSDLGRLVAFDGSFIDAMLSMEWADYRKGAKRPKRISVLTSTEVSPEKSFSPVAKAANDLLSIGFSNQGKPL